MLKKEVFVDSCFEELVLITGASCPVCRNNYATIIATVVGDEELPLLKFCPCGHVTLSKEFAREVVLRSPKLGDWI